MKKIIPVFLIVAAAVIASCVYITESNSSAIGIIGGADGPTSVLVASSPSSFPLIFGILAIILLAAAILILIYKKKKHF